MDQAPIKIGQYILGKNLGIGAFGKVGCVVILFFVLIPTVVTNRFIIQIHHCKFLSLPCRFHRVHVSRQ
jgi:hypothetical protein